METLRPATMTLEMQPRAIVATVRNSEGKLVTEAQGTTYADAARLAVSRAFSLGYKVNY